jgi:hypothetical protein
VTAESPSESILKGYAREMEHIIRSDPAFIQEICEQMDAHQKALDGVYWDHIDALKSYLGGEAANQCSDDESEQEEAIGDCEAWVADNVSNDTENWIASVLALHGKDAGVLWLRQQIAKVTAPRT